MGCLSKEMIIKIKEIGDATVKEASGIPPVDERIRNDEAAKDTAPGENDAVKNLL